MMPTTGTAAGSATATSGPAARPTTAPATALPAARRPIVETTSPERYRVQFTIGKESHDKLRRVQALLRREIPDGDPGAIFDRAIALLLERVEKQKLGATTKPRAPRPIRPGTDNPVSSSLASRHTTSHIKRSTWRHDGGQSAENISLRCRRHNQYEAEVVFGPRTRGIGGDS
jgi:hypothetical protein